MKKNRLEGTDTGLGDRVAGHIPPREARGNDRKLKGVPLQRVRSGDPRYHSWLTDRPCPLRLRGLTAYCIWTSALTPPKNRNQNSTPPERFYSPSR